jgi:hypothetical protein
VVDKLSELVTPLACWVYVVLFRHADGEGVARPSLARLALKTKRSPQQVKRAIKELQVANALMVEVMTDGRSANRYRFPEPGLWATPVMGEPPSPATPEGGSLANPPGVASEGGGGSPATPEEDQEKKTSFEDLFKDIRPHPRRGKGKGRRKARTSGAVETPGFVAFYDQYPRHIDRGDALTAWTKLAPDEDLEAAILAALIAQKQAGMFSQDLTYVAHPATWINKRRWENPITSNRGLNGTAHRPGYKYDAASDPYLVGGATPQGSRTT